MEAFFNSIADWSWLAYSFLFLVLFVESLGLPIPGLTVALVGAAMAGQGRLEIWLVVGLTVLGGVLGGLVSYHVGKSGGRRFVERWGKFILITPARLEVGERYCDRYGSKILLLARYLPVLCFASGLLSGITRLPYRRFFLLNIANITLWSATHMTAAYIFGKNLDALLQVFNNVGIAMVVVIGLIIAWIAFRSWKSRFRPRPKVTVEKVSVSTDL